MYLYFQTKIVFLSNIYRYLVTFLHENRDKKYFIITHRILMCILKKNIKYSHALSHAI